MKKYLSLILFIVLYINSAAFAYTSGKTIVDENIVYCPDHITCTETNIKSCSFDTTYSDAMYWDRFEVPERLEVAAGEHEFQASESGYHNKNVIATKCKYQNTGPNSSGPISLVEKTESNLEAYSGKATRWTDSYNSSPVYCSGETQSCPLHQQSSLKVINYYADGISVSPNSSGVNDGAMMKNGVVNLIYEDALTGCQSGKECNVRIINGGIPTSVDLGSIVVDMDNKLKILKIIPNVSTGVEILPIEPFNTVKIKNIGNSIEINNHINSKITASVNGAWLLPEVFLSPKDRAIVLIDQVLKVCGVVKQCKIDLRLSSSAAEIGSVVIDIGSKINISKVSSVRSSEISITELDSNKVDVSYQNR